MKLSIDPSINDLGWCTFDGSWHHGTISPKGNTLPAKLEFIGYALKAVCQNPSELIVEYPQHFGGSVKGSIAAVDGTCFGLAAIAGYIQGYYGLRPSKVFHYLPSTWKGSVPKAGMLYRFEHEFGYAARTDHEAEASLLLKYHMEQINKLAK